jgi:Tol biopolymer transport system component
MSADARFVAFTSDAANLVAGDTNAASDVFVRDRLNDETQRVSVSTAGAQGAKPSANAVLSGDGRFVAFLSSSALVPGSHPSLPTEVYLRDRQANLTVRISKNAEGVAANNYCGAPALSPDARFVAFSSGATNLVPGDTNNAPDAFLYDRQEDQLERVSLSSLEEEANGGGTFFSSVSADGRYVGFESAASNLVPDDTNSQTDVFVRDRQTGETERVSVSTSGAQGNLGGTGVAISADGRYVAFQSYSDNLVTGDTNGDLDVFVHDRLTRETSRVSVGAGAAQGNGFSVLRTITGDGRFVVFSSAASTLVPGDLNSTTDGFVRDRQTETTERVTVNAAGAEAGGLAGAITPDGRFVSIVSSSANLVAGDTNGWDDIFVVERASGENRSPLANAGPDQTVQASGPTAAVQLNATASSDPDGDSLTFKWTEAGQQIATGSTPTVSLALGVHTLTVTVTDPSGATAVDTVSITVNAQPTGDFPLNAHAVSSTEIRLSWIDPSSKETKFEIHRSEDGGETFQRIGTAAKSKGIGRTVTYLDRKVVAAVRAPGFSAAAVEPRTYVYRVVALLSRLVRQVSQLRFRFALAPPESLRGDWPLVTETALSLLWQNRCIGEEGVELEISVADAQGNLQPSLRRIPGTGLVQTTLIGLPTNTYHQVRIRFYNLGGESSWTNPLLFFTPPGGPARGTAEFRTTELRFSARRGQVEALTPPYLDIHNSGATTLRVFISLPEPAHIGPVPPTGADWRVNRGATSLNATTDIPPGMTTGGPNIPTLPTIRFRVGANAPVGTVNGKWVIYTSDPTQRVVVINLIGTVLP